MTTNHAETLGARPRVEVLFQGALWLFVGAIGFSVAGTLLLQVFPSVLRLFGPIYPSLVKGPTWTYMALLPVLAVLMYGPVAGWRRVALFVLWGSLVGACSELLGTVTGFPFGKYGYTSWLGPKLFGHVPYFIPLSWFAMSLLSLDLAQRVARRRWQRIGLAALFMVLWDVSLDPAMSRAFPFWTYPEGGFYFGMPASNWAGWFGVAAIIVGGYEALGGLPETSRWAPSIYLLNCLFPLAICVLYGLYPAVLLGAAATALPFVILWKSQALPERASLRLP